MTTQLFKAPAMALTRAMRWWKEDKPVGRWGSLVIACRWRRRQGYYTQLNKGCVWLILVETVSGGEQSSGHKHWEGESYGGHFLRAHLTFTPGKTLPSPWIPTWEGLTTPMGTRHWSPWHGCTHADSMLNRTSFPRGFLHSPQIDYQERCTHIPHPQQSLSDHFHHGRGIVEDNPLAIAMAHHEVCMSSISCRIAKLLSKKMWHQVIDTLATYDSNFSPHIQ